MGKSSVAVPVRSLSGNQIGDEKRTSPGWIDELLIDLNAGHANTVVLTAGDIPKFGNAAGTIPRERLIPEPKDTSAKQTSNEQLEPGGKPDKGNTFFVYTYSVARAR